MTFLSNQKLSVDAFGRARTSAPATLFDSKMIHDNLPLVYDDQEVSGGSTSSTWSQDKANVVMGVAGTTAGKRERRSFQSFNYQSGKSQLIFMTGNLGLSGGGTGIISGLGYMSANDGMALVNKEGVPVWRLRSNVSGSVVDFDTPVSLAEGSYTSSQTGMTNYNGALIEVVDSFDGSGPSGMTLDISKSLIFAVDFEWLSVGTVLFCLVYKNKLYEAMAIHNAGYLAGAYMSNPNLPLCWWIENDGTGAASTMSQLCGTVISEGGHNPNGIPQYESTGESDTAATEVSANTAGTWYAVLGLKLKAAVLGGVIEIHTASLIAETADDFEWAIKRNPTVTGTFTYGDKTNSILQTAKGGSATVTGGHDVNGGFSRAEGGIGGDVDTALSLGKAIDGTASEFVLCVRPLTTMADIHGSLHWAEF